MSPRTLQTALVYNGIAHRLPSSYKI
jgi:hypothetical protein